MVEVTVHNFKEMIPHVQKAIDESSFVAIDSEFTGLYLDSANDASLFDSMENRYQKLKARASSYLPCQIGLSTFKKDESSNRYLVATFVFYIRPYMCGSIDRKFMCQASCLDFLCQYDFDFNKFIKEGIPYLNEVDEIQVRKEIEDNTISYPHVKSIDSKYKRETDMLINNFLEPGEKHGQGIKTNKLILEKEKFCHGYFQVNELRRKYPSLKIQVEGNKIVIIKGPSSNCHDPHFALPYTADEIHKNESESLIDYFLGFTKIFRLLRSCNKPIVGHNLLMDLLLLFHNFYTPLPNTYKEFKHDLHNMFPLIYDTRHIWLHVKKYYKLKEVSSLSGLFELYEMFRNPNDSLSTLFSPDVVHTNSDKYQSEEFPHESGFDSYVTGWVFLKICHVLALNKISNTLFVQPQTFKQHLQAVQPFQNKINIARSNIRYVDLSGDDPTPVESQLLHICVRNKKNFLNQTELSKLFDKYGLIEFKLDRSRKAAILAVGNLRSFREILKDFSNDPDYDISRYSLLKHSPLVHTALWLTGLGVCTVAAFQLSKLYSSS